MGKPQVGSKVVSAYGATGIVVDVEQATQGALYVIVWDTRPTTPVAFDLASMQSFGIKLAPSE